MTSLRYFCATDEVRHRWLVAAHAVLVLHPDIHTDDFHRTDCVECFHQHFTNTFRVIFAFGAVRGTNLAGLHSCAVLLRDDRCAAVQPFTAAVDPVTAGIRRVALHLTHLSCSNRSSDVAIEFLTARLSMSLHHSLDPPASLFQSLFSCDRIDFCSCPPVGFPFPTCSVSPSRP